MTSYMTHVAEALRPSRISPSDVVMTRGEFYKRYEFLSQQELDLSEQEESLNEADALELSALANLVIKDQTHILHGKERIDIGLNRHYCVKFKDTESMQLKEMMVRYLKIDTPNKMAKAFEQDSWYRDRIRNHMTTDYLDSMMALKSAHRFNTEALAIIKKLQAMQLDIITGDIYDNFREIFHKIFDLYRTQQEFNENYNEQILRTIELYRQRDCNSEAFLSKFSSLEKETVEKLQTRGKDFKEQYESVVLLAKRTCNKARQEMERLDSTLPPHKIFIASTFSTGRHLKGSPLKSYMVLDNDTLFETAQPQYPNKVARYVERRLKAGIDHAGIEAECEEAAVWKIERVDRKMVDSINYAMAAISQSVKEIESIWKTKLRILNEQTRSFGAFALDRDIIPESGPNLKFRGHQKAPSLNDCSSAILMQYDPPRNPSNLGPSEPPKFQVWSRFRYTSKKDSLRKSLRNLSFLHAAWMQNALYNQKLEDCCQREIRLSDRPVLSMGTGQKIFIQHSKSGKYLMCQQDDVDQSVKDCENSEVFFVSESELNERAVWCLAEDACQEGGMIIRNLTSKRYLVHSSQEILSGKKVMSNPLTLIRNKQIEEFGKRKMILENTQMYEGLWNFIKASDFIAEIEGKMQSSIGKDRVAMFSGKH